jgi:hypothetical protein
MGGGRANDARPLVDTQPSTFVGTLPTPARVVA